MNTSSMVVFVRASTSEIVVDNSPNRIRCFLGSELLIAIRCFIGSDCNSIVTYKLQYILALLGHLTALCRVPFARCRHKKEKEVY